MLSLSRPLVRLFLLALFAITVVACEKGPAESYETIADVDQANQILERLTSQPMFNVASVHVARFMMDGNETEVTSLLPAYYRGYRAKVRGFKPQPGQSFTMAAFNEKRTEFELFTRDGDASTAYHQVVPIAAIDAQLTLIFPLTHEDGTVKPAVIAFVEHKAR
jgi:hypothetical protein